MSTLISHQKNMSLDFSVPAVQMFDGKIKMPGSRHREWHEEMDDSPASNASGVLIDLALRLKVAMITLFFYL